MKWKPTSFLAILFLILAIPISLILLSQIQEPRKEAAGPKTSSQASIPSNPPIIINNLVNISLTSITIMLTWKTDIPTTSYVAYSDELSSFNSSDPLKWGKWRIHLDNSSSLLTTNHKIIVGNLKPKSTYYYKVSGQNYPQTGLWCINPPMNSFTTTSVPVIYSDPKAIDIQSTMVTITWVTDYPTTSSVAYSDESKSFDSPDPSKWGKWRINQDSIENNPDSMKTDHSIKITNVKPNTTYYYRVYGWDFPTDSGSIVFSTLKSFITD